MRTATMRTATMRTATMRTATMRTDSIVLAWHFAPSDRRLANGDGRPIEAGSVFSVEPPLEICHRGLHGSVRPLDALYYARSPIVSRTEHSGEMLHENDKLCSSVRRHLWVEDASAVLHEYACWCAEEALREAGVTDAHCRKAIAAKRAWVRGEITDDALQDARDAAWFTIGKASSTAPKAVATTITIKVTHAVYGATDPIASCAARTAAIFATQSTAAILAAQSAAHAADVSTAAMAEHAYETAYETAYEAIRATTRERLNDELERRLLLLAPTA